MSFELKREKNVFHNCNDERMIDWCIEHLTGHDGDYRGKYGFGCSCQDTEDEEELKEYENGYHIGFYNITKEDDSWESWMEEFNDMEIRFYFCGKCQEWAIDDDC